MNNLLSFAYESGICMAALFGLYWIFLRKETYFRFNRFYLLSTIMFAFLIPSGNFRLSGFHSDASVLSMITGLGEAFRLPEVIIAGGSKYLFSLPESWPSLVILLYLLGASLILIKMLSGILRIMKLKSRGKKIKADGYTLVYISRNLPPFSFFRNIFINESLTENSQKKDIINHEIIHVRQLHTYDNLIVEIFLALFWFNPFMWFLRRSLRNTHEYLADQGIKKTNASLGDYHSLLLGQATGLSPISITNNFNSMIKNRIKMMIKSKSTVLAKFKPLLAIPVLLCLSLVFACSDSGMENLSEEQTETLKSGMNNKAVEEEVFYIVEEMPAFQGNGTEGFREWISQNIRYPEIAKEKGISGKVYIQFAVNSRGEVVDAMVVRGVDPALDKEAVRVVMSSPGWEPGKQRGRPVKVQFTFPVNFVLD